ncbi:MAG: hypothetical protein HAW67_04685 [Endozoicomonadaceae bacterium]|nr:hypothetical protein [Endozoicomonadaceae bacterium]
MYIKIPMPFNEYARVIDYWAGLAEDQGILLSDGAPLPTNFWKTFLGITRRAHENMYNGTDHTVSGCVPTYVVKTIYYANKMDKETFFEEVRKNVPEFESDKRR